jgi:DNA-binding beta-propeller fold protein YncE
MDEAPMDETLDCRGSTVPEAGRAIIARFNASDPGATFGVRLDAYPAGLRMWLLEAGARNRAARESDGGWRLEVERRGAPAQGSVPGAHHVVSGTDGSVWTAERARRVARIDAAERRVVATAVVARKASHLALDVPRGRLIVADAEAGEVIALRAADLHELARWPAPGMPQLPRVSVDGVVCVTGGASGTVTIARPRGSGYAATTVEIGASPHDPLLSNDGVHLFVPCAGSGEVAKLRLDDACVVGRARVGAGPSHLALHPRGDRLYSANSWDGTVTCLSAEGEILASAESGGWAHAIDLTPDGRWLFVGNFMDDTLSVFDADSLARVAVLPTEPYPHGLDVSPDGTRVVATGFGSDCVRVFDARAHRELGRVAVGAGSSHTAFTDGGATAFVGCSVDGHVACVELDALGCTARIRI